MTRLPLTLLAALGAASLLSAAKPNIILINVDDLGYSDISPFGGSLATPRLERMAREGMKLSSHYAAPVCSPSRAAMTTGCYPKRVLPIPGVLFPAAAVGLNPEEQTVAEVLKGAGYATACFGKWHLGDQPEFLPTAQGFDHYYGIPYSNDMGPAADGSKSNPDQPLPKAAKNSKAKGADREPETGLKGQAQPPLPMLENLKVVQRVRQSQQHHMSRDYTRRALQWIAEKKAGPFFVYLAHNAVHWPHYPHESFMGKSGISLQKDWVLEMDSLLGELLDGLAAMGLDEQTLVVFTSDNGGPINQGAQNTPLRGAKGSTWEGGMRVCTLARWPGHIAANSTAQAITAHMDWLPTFASLAEAKRDESRRIDGMDLSPLLLGQPKFMARDHFFYFKGFKLEALRQGPWKLHLGPKPQLYRLDQDLGESRDLAAEEPKRVEQLRALAQSMAGDLGLDGNQASGIRPLGRNQAPKPLLSPP